MPPKTKSNLQVALIALPLITLACGVVWQGAIASGQIEANKTASLENRTQIESIKTNEAETKAILRGMDERLKGIQKSLDRIER